MSLNREEVYNREKIIHDDSQFDEKRVHEVSFLYERGSFAQIYNKAYRIIGDLKNKRILEYGCGVGRHLIYFCEHGSYYTGIDISSLRINQAKKLIDEKNLQKCANAVEMNAEKLEFPEGFFDVIFGEAIIHHLDIDISMKQLLKVLKKKGIALFLEPRGNNPVINRFRNKTPHLRTIDEHPLTNKDFDIMKKYFAVKTKDYYCFSLAAFIFRRYLKNEFLFNISRLILGFGDSVIFALFPFMRKYAWYSIITLKNKV